MSQIDNPPVAGSGSNAAAGPTGSPVPASADYIGINVGGNLVGVSSTNPLPISGSISATNPSVGSTGTTAPTSATEMGIIVSGNLVGVSASNPVPVSGTFADPAVGTIGSTAPTSADQIGFNSGGNLQSVSSTNPLPVAVEGTLTVDVGNFPSTQPVSGTVAVSNFPSTQPVSGTVSISGSVAVTGTFWQATQPVSGTVAVSNFPSTQPVSGTVAVSNFPATQPVSGTVAISNTGFTNTDTITNFPSVQAITNNPGDAFVAALADTDGNLVTVTDNALDVHIKQEDAVPICDSTGQPLVLSAGAVPVAQQGPVSVTPIALPPNAAQESGGNLAAINAIGATNNAILLLQQQQLDMLRQINATLKVLLLMEQHNSANAYFDQDDELNAETVQIN